MSSRTAALLSALVAVLAIAATNPAAWLTEQMRDHEHKRNAALGASQILPAERLEGGFPCITEEGEEVGLAAEMMPCKGIDLLSYIPTEEYSGDTTLTEANPLDTQESSDMWGWTDPQDGREYVMIGKTNGVAFYDITEPEHPVHVASIDNSAPVQLLWHDIKVYDDHAFIVSESNGHGMLVFDLTRLRPDGERDPDAAPQLLEPDAIYPFANAAHNIAINEETGFAYILGGNTGLVVQDQCRSGLHMVDISTPTLPVFAGCYLMDGGPGTAAQFAGYDSPTVAGVRTTGAYVHDAQCVIYRGPDEDHHGKELCFNAAEDRVVIADVTTKALPTTIASVTYPAATYTHQAWLTEDHRYLLVNDELDEETPGNDVVATRTIIFDLEDLDDPGEAMIHNHHYGAIDHNLYIRGEGLFQSHYAVGLRVSDLDRVGEGILEEVAFLDVHPDHDHPDFFGTWSNYPYFDSGTIAVSGYEGLWLVRLHDDVIADIED